MAKRKEIIINCGNSHVSGGIFNTDGETTILEHADMETLSHDLSNDTQWLNSVVEGIERLSEKMKLKGDARIIFPGSLLLTKTIRVPKVEEEKQTKIVAFELSQKMPFPLSELIWDYQVIDDDGVEQEILAFAVKPEVAESFCERVVEIGLNPIQITPAPVLDFNALKATMRRMEETTPETLIVNIGAKSTNLLFLNPTGFLIRNIAIGGNSLTQNLSDNLGINFEKAEELKKGYFTGRVTFSQEDPNVQVLESCSKQFLARASQEITRSIVTYKRVKKGRSPQKIFLTGRGSLLSNLPEYISQTQQLDIDYFDPIKALSLGEEISTEMQGLLPFMFSEPIGLASNLFSAEDKDFAKSLNLLPSSKLSSLGLQKKLPLVAASAFVLSLLPLPAYLSNSKELSALDETLKRQTQVVRQEGSRLDEISEKHKHYQFIDKLSSEVFTLSEPYVRQQSSCWRITSLVNSLQQILSEADVKDTWYDQLNVYQETTSSSGRRGARSAKDENSVFKLTLTGRYLVRIDESKEIAENDDSSFREVLIDLNSKKQQALTEHLQNIPFISKVDEKVFSIDGKGDLFNRYFTHFSYEFTLSF